MRIFKKRENEKIGLVGLLESGEEDWRGWAHVIGCMRGQVKIIM
jgi:hypothetical protein